MTCAIQPRPPGPALRGARRALVAILLLAWPRPLLAAPGGGEEGPSPPELHWRKAPRALVVRVVPSEGSRLAPLRPLELALLDGEHFTIRWRQPASQDGRPQTVRLPRLASRASIGWSLEVHGGFCASDGRGCRAFTGAAEVPRRGRGRGRALIVAGAGLPADDETGAAEGDGSGAPEPPDETPPETEPAGRFESEGAR